MVKRIMGRTASHTPLEAMQPGRSNRLSFAVNVVEAFQALLPVDPERSRVRCCNHIYLPLIFLVLKIGPVPDLG